MRLPTIWISNRCKQTGLSLKNWRIEEWANSSALVTKDKKDKPQQKWSHFCTALEAIFKDSRFRPQPAYQYVPPRKSSYFNGRR